MFESVKKFLLGFKYAFEGIAYCLSERNMRVHLCFTAWMFGFLTIYDFFEVSRIQFAVLVCICGVVMSLEMLNTAIERIVDMVTSEKHPLAKAAKDAAAGAVLVSAFAAVIIGLLILYQPEAFEKMFEYYSSNIHMIFVFVLCFAASCVFAFAGPKKIIGFFKKKKEEK